MDEQRGSTSSINFDILSVGIANAQPIAVHHAALVDNVATGSTTPQDNMDEFVLPSPNFSKLSPRNAFATRAENMRPLPLSTGTMEDFRRPQTNRRSIIDPATVRLSFTGSISDMSSPLALPLEEGLQKLYQLYNEYVADLLPSLLTFLDTRIQPRLSHILCLSLKCPSPRSQMLCLRTSSRSLQHFSTAHRTSTQ